MPDRSLPWGIVDGPDRLDFLLGLTGRPLTFNVQIPKEGAGTVQIEVELTGVCMGSLNKRKGWDWSFSAVSMGGPWFPANSRLIGHYYADPDPKTATRGVIQLKEQ